MDSAVYWFIGEWIGPRELTPRHNCRYSVFSWFVGGERCRLAIGLLRGRGGACFDSLGDLNFMEEPLMVVWTIRRIGCWIIGG